MKNSHGGKRAGAGRPPAPPEVKARAITLAEELGSPEAAAERLKRDGVPGCSSRQIRVWMADAGKGPGGAGKGAGQGDRTVAHAGAASPPPEPTTRRPEADPPPVEPPPVPSDLAGPKRDLWLLGWEIDQTRRTLAILRAEGSTRTAAIQAQLLKLIDARADIEKQLREEGVEDEETRWRKAAAEARKKISDGLAAARERMSALLGRPFPYAVDVVRG